MVYCTPTLRLANGAPHDASLPNGTQSASKVKELLSGLELLLPVVWFGWNSTGSAGPQVRCQPAVNPYVFSYQYDAFMRIWSRLYLLPNAVPLALLLFAAVPTRFWLSCV